MIYWNQFKSINNNSIHNMKRKSITDYRRVLSGGEISFEYNGIGKL